MFDIIVCNMFVCLVIGSLQRLNHCIHNFHHLETPVLSNYSMDPGYFIGENPQGNKSLFFCDTRYAELSLTAATTLASS